MASPKSCLNHGPALCLSCLTLAAVSRWFSVFPPFPSLNVSKLTLCSFRPFSRFKCSVAAWNFSGRHQSGRHFRLLSAVSYKLFFHHHPSLPLHPAYLPTCIPSHLPPNYTHTDTHTDTDTHRHRDTHTHTHTHTHTLSLHLLQGLASWTSPPPKASMKVFLPCFSPAHL